MGRLTSGPDTNQDREEAACSLSATLQHPMRMPA